MLSGHTNMQNWQEEILEREGFNNKVKDKGMNDSDIGFDDSFADFVDEMTNSKVNEKACSIDNPECEGCGS
jgi:hypothetical protein|tara:strand:- start:262 stop:474 length:213 start_codon:yes stop_codon:yes gene_type:complete